MKIFSVVLVFLLATSAWASKARVTALQYADHLVDVQTAFKNPAYINQLSPLLTLEMAAAGKAEGGMLMKTDSSNNILVYAGHQNTFGIGAGADARSANSYLSQNNPVEVLYGAGTMAFGGSLSTVDNKKSGTKETTLIGKWGMISDGLYLYAHLSLVSTAEIKATTGDKKINAAPGLIFGASKDSGNMRYFGALTYGNAKNEVGGTSTDIKDMDIKIGLEDRSMRKSDADIYYGTLLNYSTREVGKKITAMSLPVFLGIETPVTSWLTFRGSVAQNFLIGSFKDETATNTDADGIATNTTASAGLGFKYNNLILDGVLTAGTSGDINGNQFLSTASVTYNF